MAITIARPVVIKAIVTESFKRLYTQELQSALARVEELIAQIDTQIRRTELERQITPSPGPSASSWSWSGRGRKPPAPSCRPGCARWRDCS